MSKLKFASLPLLLIVCLELVASTTYWADICAHQEDGVRLPSPMDCAMYVICEDYEVVALNRCPRGLHFNPKVGECDFQWRADCSGLALFASSTDGACSCDCCVDECSDEETDTTIECDTNSTPSPSSTEVDFTDAEDSTISTTVNPVTTTASTTTASTTTASTTQKPSGSTTTAGTSGSSTTTTTLNPGASSSIPTPNPTSALPAYCDNSNTDCVDQANGAILPVPNNCGKYITCNGGCAIIQQCPSGLYYDFIKSLCNYPWDVDCSQTLDDDEDLPVGPSGTTCTDQGVCAGQRDGTLFANPDTNGFFVCQCQCPIAMGCDAGTKFNETAKVCDWDRSSNTETGGSSAVLCPDGLVYNATSDECDYPEGYVPNVICNNTLTICEGQPEGTLYPMDGVCNKFYKCNYNCAVEQICPNNLVYDPRYLLCNYPQNYECEWERIPPTGPDAGPSGIACETNGRCLNQREGALFPSLTSCSKYVVCQCECEVEMECSGGLYWDQELSTCNYAKNVTCNI